MTDDPNKKQNQGTGSSQYPNTQKDESSERFPNPNQRNQGNESNTQRQNPGSRHDSESDNEESQEKGGQRKAS
jgi:hypothetical protein